MSRLTGDKISGLQTGLGNVYILGIASFIIFIDVIFIFIITLILYFHL
jgi:hypothetical protein